MTVGELLARCSSAELTEWQAYEEIAGPLGDRRGDWQAASICAVVYNMLRGEQSPPMAAKDLLISWGRAEQDPAEIEATARQLASTYGGTWTEADE